MESMPQSHSGYCVQVLLRGPNVPDPRNPDTIRKSHSTVALTRQAIHDGSVPRVVTTSASKAPHAATASVADIKVDAPGRRRPFHAIICLPSPLLRRLEEHARITRRHLALPGSFGQPVTTGPARVYAASIRPQMSCLEATPKTRAQAGRRRALPQRALLQGSTL